MYIPLGIGVDAAARPYTTVVLPVYIPLGIGVDAAWLLPCGVLPLEIWVDAAIVLCRGVVDALRNQGRYSLRGVNDFSVCT